MRAVTDWRHYPHPFTRPTRNTGNVLSDVTTNNHRTLSITRVAGPRSQTVRSEATTSWPMMAVSEVFSEFWNLIMSKAARPSRLVSEVITSLSLSIQSFPYLFLQIDQYPPPLRPQFTTPSIQSVNLHTPTPATFLAPSALDLVVTLSSL